MLLNDSSDRAVLCVRNLTVCFRLPQMVVHAVAGVSFDVRRGVITALVGESGCGKSVTALSVLGLLDGTDAVTSGEILIDGNRVRSLDKRKRRRLCGEQVGMVFQDPVNSLDPLFPVGYLVMEAIRAHRPVGRKESRQRAVRLLERMQLPDPERIMGKYPFQLSGGMCQRIMIAIAMAQEPPLLIVDEPTTALDVTIQAQILDQIVALSRENGTGVLFITHDLGVVAEVADDICIMKNGEIVETGSVEKVFHQAQHPYTRMLLEAIL